MALAEEWSAEPVIDSVRPFTQIVDAHRRVDGGHKSEVWCSTFS